MFASRTANYVSRFTLYLIRTRPFNVLLPWLLNHMTFAIPVHRLHETPTLLAFHHPKPRYALHILPVSKRDRKSLADLRSADMDFLNDLFQTVKMLVERFNLEGPGYRLIANGGQYQDIPNMPIGKLSGLSPNKHGAQVTRAVLLPTGTRAWYAQIS